MKKIFTFLLPIALVMLCGCYTSKKASDRCTSAKELNLNRIELWRLQWFVSRTHKDNLQELRLNGLSFYCFKPEVVDNHNIGLVYIKRHAPFEGVFYFINGEKFITPLKIGEVAPEWHKLQSSEEDKNHLNEVLEAALARHAHELDDSLKYRIRQAFVFSRK